MATFQKRGNAWRVQVRMRGVAKSASFDTKEEGRAWATQVEAALSKVQAVNTKADGFLTVVDIMQKYKREVSINKKGAHWENNRIEMLCRDPLFEMPFRDFTSDVLASWRDDRLKMVSPATVNRDLNLIGSIFTHAAKEWRMGSVANNPLRQISRPKNPKARTRRVSDAEVRAICDQLGWDGCSAPSDMKHQVAWVLCFAIETAMRKGEILSISWAQVNLGGLYVSLRDGQTKNGDGRDVPLSERAVELLSLMIPGRPADSVVAVSSGSVDYLFRRAVQAAGIPDLHFHDTRREATTRMAPAMGDPLTLGRVTGHRDLKSLWTYYNPTGTDLAMRLRAKPKG